MKEIYIFGASNLGEIAYKVINNSYLVKGFIDNDLKKVGQKFCSLPVYPSSIISNLDSKIMIASSYWREIEIQLLNEKFYNYQIFNYEIISPNLKNSKLIHNRLSSVSLGALISSIDKNLMINDITFLNGGSTIMDYFFLQAVAIRLKAKTFLEIGTWTGESIGSLAEIVEKCFSISLPDNDLGLINVFEDYCNKENFSRYFSRKINNILHFEENSFEFDFSKIPEKIDLVFIDGDHSYQGISSDTKNVFNKCGYDESVIIWHDFKTSRNELIETTFEAVIENIPMEYRGNLYAVQGNLCGIYIPHKYKHLFEFEERKQKLFSYEVNISVKENNFAGR